MPAIARHASRIPYALLALTALGAGVWLIGQWWSTEGIPPRSSLSPVSGMVVAVESRKGDLRFRLAGIPAAFLYTSQSGELHAVQLALARQPPPHATVLIRSLQVAAALRNPDLLVTVQEIRLDKELLRSHAQIDASWRSHHAWGAGFGAVLLIAAGAAARRAGRPLPS